MYSSARRDRGAVTKETEGLKSSENNQPPRSSTTPPIFLRNTWGEKVTMRGYKYAPLLEEIGEVLPCNGGVKILY